MNKDELQTAEKLVMEINEGLIENYAYVPVKVDGLGAHGMKVLYFSVCTSPESPAFGAGCGVFLYKDAVYRFHFDLGSNHMTVVEQVVLKQDKAAGPYVKHEETAFGRRAFWDDTSMDDLDEIEKALRRLMRSLESYVSRQGWPGHIKRNAALHKREMEHRETGRRMKLVRDNSVYGITGGKT